MCAQFASTVMSALCTSNKHVCIYALSSLPYKEFTFVNSFFIFFGINCYCIPRFPVSKSLAHYLYSSLLSKYQLFDHITATTAAAATATTLRLTSGQNSFT